MPSTSFLPFQPNFSSTHSVVIDAPISRVYRKLATSEGHVEVAKLSELCTSMEIREEDTVAIPAGKQVTETSVRTQPKVQETPEEADNVTIAKRLHFEMEETVPLLYGLVKNRVVVRGTVTWTDPPSSIERGTVLYGLYESEAAFGIQIWKSRVFEEVEIESEGSGETSVGTKVTEIIQGWAPIYLKYITAKKARIAHLQQMGLYHTLFR